MSYNNYDDDDDDDDDKTCSKCLQADTKDAPVLDRMALGYAYAKIEYISVSLAYIRYVFSSLAGPPGALRRLHDSGTRLTYFRTSLLTFIEWEQTSRPSWMRHCC